MDNEIFKQFIQQHYTLKTTEPEYVYTVHHRRKIKHQLEEIQQVEGWDEDPDMVQLVLDLEDALNPKPNPTLPLEIKECKSRMGPCDDCGQIVTNRLVKRALYSFPVKHWRTNCSSCKMTQNPETKQFDIPTQQSQFFFTSLLRDRDK